VFRLALLSSEKIRNEALDESALGRDIVEMEFEFGDRVGEKVKNRVVCTLKG